MQWFRNIAAATPVPADSTSIDYSLQLASGIQNQTSWLNACTANPGAKMVLRGLERLAAPPHLNGQRLAG